MFLKTEQLFVLYPWMTWIIISGLLGNSKIHLVTKIKGCPFMTSTKNDQFLDPHPDCLQRNEQYVNCSKTIESANT